MRKVNKKNQMTEGRHITYSDLDVGDELVPAFERGDKTHTGSTDGSKTYFVPPGGEDYTWGFINDMTEHHHAVGDSGVTAKRPRLLHTEPSQDQEYDTNHLRGTLETGYNLAKSRGSRTPKKDAIAHARSNAPRTASRQRITGVSWAPSPKEGQWVEQTLSHVNWNQFGGENYRTHTPSASWNERGGYRDKTPLLKQQAIEETSTYNESQERREIPGQLSLDGENGVSFPEAPAKYG